MDFLKSGEDNKSRWKVYAVVIIGVLIAGGLLFICWNFILTPIVDDYIKTKPISTLYDFYDLNVGQTENAIYFIGNSQIGADVYIPLIQNELNEKGFFNLTLYNLQRSSDNPLRRLSQIEDIIESKPSMVIYGVSPWIFTTNNDGWVDEDVILIKDRLNLNSSADSIYSEDELSDMYESTDSFYFKTFLKSAIINFVTHSSKITDPIIYTTQDTWDAWTTDEKREEYSNTFGVNGQNLIDYVEITDSYANTSRNKIPLTPFVFEQTRKLQAFEYILDRFEQENITVVLVVMPEHSIINNLTPLSSEENLHDYLNSTNLDWYDLDELYGDEIMADLTHVHWDGAVELASVWADIIIQELS